MHPYIDRVKNLAKIFQNKIYKLEYNQMTEYFSLKSKLN